jgi:carboxylesterase
VTSLVGPQTRPYEGGDGPVGVLLVHGFTSTPQSMRPWAEHLVAAGFRVSVPLLPGHGTTWQQLNRTDWTEWYDAVDVAFSRLRAACTSVFVGGLSMGACLALRLAEQRGDEVSGLVLVNPVLRIADPRILALPVLKWLTPSLGAIANDIARPGSVEVAYDRNPLRALHAQTRMWRDVRDHLDRVTSPLLVYRSQSDHVVDASSLPILREGVRSRDATYRALTRSYHVATLDYEAEEIFAGSVEFIRRRVRS